MQVKLEGLKKDFDKVSVKAQEILKSPQESTSSPVLRSELDLTVQKMDHTYMLSSIYLEKWDPQKLYTVSILLALRCAFYWFTVSCTRLKIVEMVIRNSQGAEGVLKQYEDYLREVHTVPSDTQAVETYRTKLKVIRNFEMMAHSRLEMNATRERQGIFQSLPNVCLHPNYIDTVPFDNLAYSSRLYFLFTTHSPVT